MVNGLERAKQAWALGYEGLSQEEVDRRVRGFTAIVRGIARDGAVRPSTLAAELGIEVAEARELFSALESMGMEFDAAGNIVGAALTTKPTAHTVRIRDHEPLYAWCALDTLFIPGLVGEPAAIESTCPVSGDAIRLSVSPEGVLEHTPDGAVLSVFLPGSSGAPRTGPASPT